MLQKEQLSATGPQLKLGDFLENLPREAKTGKEITAAEQLNQLKPAMDQLNRAVDERKSQIKALADKALEQGGVITNMTDAILKAHEQSPTPKELFQVTARDVNTWGITHVVDRRDHTYDEICYEVNDATTGQAIDDLRVSHYDGNKKLIDEIILQRRLSPSGKHARFDTWERGRAGGSATSPAENSLCGMTVKTVEGELGLAVDTFKDKANFHKEQRGPDGQTRRQEFDLSLSGTVGTPIYDAAAVVNHFRKTLANVPPVPKIG